MWWRIYPRLRLVPMLRSSKFSNFLVFGCLVFFLGQSQALADDSHYQDFVVGGRAVGLGGAFCSIADDSSGIYYNPAGIADSSQTSLQISTSLYGFERGSYDLDNLTLPIPGVENLDVQFTDLIVVPASAGAVKTFGKIGPDGEPTEAYAFSVVVPSYRSFAITAPFASEGQEDDPAYIDSALSYSRRVTDRTLWTGFGYARKLDHRFRVGFSAHYILRSIVDIEKVASSGTLSFGNDDSSSSEGASEVFDTATNDISFLNGSIVFGAGIKFKSGLWQLGASIQSPSWQVHSRAELRSSRGQSVPQVDCSELSATSEACGEEGVLALGGKSQFTVYQPKSVGSETKYASTLRVGASFSLPHKLTISGDLIYHLPVSYNLVDLDEKDAKWLPFNPKVSRKQVLNMSFGFEYLMIREVSIGAGVFSDFSSAPEITESYLSTDKQPHVDLLGLSMALGYFSEHSLTRFGLLYSSGAGEDVIPVNTTDKILEKADDYHRVGYFQSFFYVFISSTYRY